MRRSLLLFCVSLSLCWSYGQTPITSWVKTTTITSSEDYIFDVLQMPDSGYVLAGSYRTAAKPFSDYLLERTKKNGDTLWTKNWGGTSQEAITTIAARPGGGYVVGGGASWTYAFLDNNFNVTTSFTLGSYSFLDVTVLPDSGFIFTGSSGGYPISSDVGIVRTKKNGDTLWTRKYGTVRADIGRAIIPTSDGNFVVAGHANYQYFADGSYIPQLAYILKFNSAGDTLWTDTIPRTVLYRSDALDVLENKLGQFVISGWATADKALLAAWTSSGTLSWQKQLTHPYAGTGQNASSYYSFEQRCDGGYVAAGYCTRPSGSSGLVVSTDIGGDTLSTKIYGQGGTYLRSIIPTFDSGFFVGGFTGGTQNYSVNPYMVKLDAQAGNGTLAAISCNYSSTVASNTATFKDLSLGAVHWYWTFGDGGTSTAKNPVHTYTAPGNYSVCLKVWNYCDTTSYCHMLAVGNVTLSVARNTAVLSEIQIYPSPTSDILHVSLNSTQAGVASFKLFDLAGRRVGPMESINAIKVGSNNLTVNLSDLSAGVYFLEIASDTGTKYRAKIIKVD